MSQPNLTRGLKQLEALLGVPIFDRQGVTPTSFGEIILRHGDKALASFHELTRELSLAKGLEVGELRIIAGPYPANISGERAVGVLLQRHPNIFAEIRSANWERAIGDVLDGSAEFLIRPVLDPRRLEERRAASSAGEKIAGVLFLRSRSSAGGKKAPRPRGPARIPMGGAQPSGTLSRGASRGGSTVCGL